MILTEAGRPASATDLGRSATHSRIGNTVNRSPNRINLGAVSRTIDRSLREKRKHRPARLRNEVRPGVEGLESRIVLYSASGNAWPNPQLITVSFMPDGTNLGGGVSSNLISTFNSKASLAGWENVILQAAQVWAQQTNINFAVVPDNGAPEGSGPDEQGNPGFGDIRIGGYNFGSSTLALTFQPPPANNFSIAGDVTFNTGQAFNIGSTYDLYTVAVHEIGHALGLNDSSVSSSVEYGTYTGKKTGLGSDDIAGIRSIYSSNGPRTADAYNTNGSSNGTVSKAANISTSSPITTVSNLDITTAGQLEYYTFMAPSGTGGTLTVDVQSSGLSLLAPKLTVYGSNGTTVLASANGPGQYGTTLTASITGVTAGERFYVEVQGADTTPMGTGRFALGLNFGANTSASVASTTMASHSVVSANGSPVHAGDGQADDSSSKGYGIGSPVIDGITPDNGVSGSDGVTNSPYISLFGSAPANDIITIYENGTQIGQTSALLGDTWTYSNMATKLSDGVFSFTAMATDPSGFSTPVSSPYQVVIDTHVPNSPVLNDISPDTGFSNTDGITDVNTPTFSGLTEAFAVVELYSNGSTVPFGATEADILGAWSYTVGQPGQVTYPGASTSILGSVVGVLQGITSSGIGSLLSPVVGVVQGVTSGTGTGTVLADGTYNVTATAMDIAGTTSAPSPLLTVVIDTQPPPAPVVTGISPDTGASSTDGTTTAQNLTIFGTAQAGTLVAVMLSGVLLSDTMAGTNGAWSYNNTAMTLPDRNYAITAQASDVAGNVSPVSAPFDATIETVSSPVIAGVSLATTSSGILGLLGVGKSLQSLSIIGTAPANDCVLVYLGTALLGSATANAQGAWSYNYVPGSSTVPNGTYSFSAVTKDASGNVSVPSPAFLLQVGGGSIAATPKYSSGVISGQATAGSLVTIVDGNVVLGVVVADSSGNWQFTPALAKGKHIIMAEATNTAGDTSLLSGALDLNV